MDIKYVKINIMKRILAFTFAELMISLVIISVITALLYPTISELAPNNNEYLYKSTYRTIESVVSDIVSGNNTTDNPAVQIAEKNRISGEMPTSARDVCKYFAAKLNKIAVDADAAECAAANPVLQTSNGARWLFEKDGNNTVIFVDVNPTNNSNGDSTYNTHAQVLDPTDGHEIKAATKGWKKGSFSGENNPHLQDTFSFVISPRGKITVSDYGANYLKDND